METRALSFLVTPERFTREELGYVTRPLTAPTPAKVTMLNNWLKRSGGVNGQPLGIHADHLRPAVRVLRAALDELGLDGV